MTVFDQAFNVIVGSEGGFSTDPNDSGNWTSHIVGTGELRGTKYGISAASFPTLDIADLTLDQSRAIYSLLFWTPSRCDTLPPGLALLVFDAAVLQGVGAATKLLQAAVGTDVDGQWGPMSTAALAASLARAGPDGVCAEFLARRIVAMSALATWPDYALGWSRRLASLPYQAQAMTLVETVA